jgi:hypothetical protein
MIINGKIINIDNNKIKIQVDNPEIFQSIHENYTKPYQNDICTVKTNNYYINILTNHIGKNVIVEVNPTRYCFRDKKGTILILKSIHEIF